MLEFILFYEYFDYYARIYNIDKQKLITVAKIESNFNPKFINKNKNGTYDYGIMQVNSFWINHLSKKFNEKVTIKKLLDPKYNIKYGAYIYSLCVNKFGDNLKAVDCYNKGYNASYNSNYTKKFVAEYKKIRYYDTLINNLKNDFYLKNNMLISYNNDIKQTTLLSSYTKCTVKNACIMNNKLSNNIYVY